jgi:CHAT domain-containing protein/lipopolysaccharide biosynthesis regulator YciM
MAVRKYLGLCLALNLCLSCGLGALAVPLTDPVRGNSQDDLANLKVDVEKARAGGKEKGLAKALFYLGKALSESRNFDEGLKYLNEALVLDKKVGQPSDIFEDLISIALVYSYKKDFLQAEAVYKEALALAKGANNIKFLVRIDNNLAALYVHDKRMSEAETLYKEAAGIAKENQDYVGEAQARLNLALVFNQNGKLVAAIDELVAARHCLGDAAEPSVLSQLAMNLANLKERQGLFDEAQDSYREASKLYQGQGEFERQAGALVALGNSLLVMGRANDAAHAYNEAIGILQQEGSDAKLANAVIRFGAALADQGKFEQAQKEHLKALELTRAINGKGAKNEKELDAYRTALYELAYDYYLAGQIDKAERSFQELAGSLGTGPKEKELLAQTRAAMARCFSATGKTQFALAALESASKLNGELGLKLAQVSCENSIACLYLDSGNAPAYEKQYLKVKALLIGLSEKDKASLDYKRILAYVDYNWGQYQLLADQYASARQANETALANFRESKDQKGTLKALTGLGLIDLLEAGKANIPEAESTSTYQSALNYFSQAEPLALSLGSLEGQWDCALGRGTALRRLKRLDASEESLLKAISLFEREKAQFSRDDSKTFSLDLRSTGFDELVTLYQEQGLPEKALFIAERGRARAFLDLLEGRKQSRVLDAGVVSPIATSVTGVDVPSANVGVKPVVNSVVSSAAAARGLAAVPLVENSTSRAVSVVPRATSEQGVESVVSTVNAQAASLEELKQLVKQSGSYVLEYSISRDKLHIFLLDPQGNVLKAVTTGSGRAAINKLTQEAYQAIVEPPKTMAMLLKANELRQDCLVKLYKELIEPVEAALPSEGDKVITIVPHGPLFKVPFCALLSPRGEFFVEKHTLAVVPAISVFRATHCLAQELETKADKLLAFGNPTIAAVGGLGQLPYAEKEVQKIASLFGGDKSIVRVGAQASKANLTKLAGAATVIHLATHGLTDEEHPMDSAVLLASVPEDDGILTVRDIFKLPNIRAKLVTLSACQTGRGRISGDGVAGLSRAFIIAGTPSVMVSLWNVDDVMTEFQMETFYKGYLGGLQKARALREAQIKTINFMEKGLQGMPKTSSGMRLRANPKYWAAFQMVGESK